MANEPAVSANESSAAVLRAATASPLHLLPRPVERIWGTPDLRPYFPPSDKRIGEVWLTAEECRVDGTAATLGDLATALPEQLGAREGAGFPLLLKLLFPSEKLSVQVHPDDAAAQATLGQPRGKTECWYILSAEPGAHVAVGFRRPVTHEEIRLAIQDGSIEEYLRLLPVQAGDMIFVDAGTVHAIGPGMVLLEVQQYSDVTYRLWDYGRPRELHVDAGLAVTRFATQAGRVAPVSMDGFERLLNCPYFAVDRFRLAGSQTLALGSAGALQILVALGEGVTLSDENRATWPLPRAHAVLLPAGVPGYRVQAHNDADVIRVLDASVLQPTR